MFIDKVTVYFVAGKGGNGVVTWRREKYIPKGGPTGGDGGRGADIIFQADENMDQLDWFVHKRHIKASDGGPGGANCRHGRNGKHLVLKVPCGTLVKDPETDEIIADLTQHGEEYTLCRGGKGGFGNHGFRSSTNQAPYIATPGEPGEEKKVVLELKTIADVGLVGFPNAGKSTFLAAIAEREVEIGAYPFTTLQPNIGWIQERPELKRVILADIPGIIEGAHQNKGLGLAFLRHIERTHILVYVIDIAGIDGRDPIEDFRVLRNELESYDPDLLKKPSLIVLNKTDYPNASDEVIRFKKEYPEYEHRLFTTAAHFGTGLKEVAHELFSLLKIEDTKDAVSL